MLNFQSSRLKKHGDSGIDFRDGGIRLSRKRKTGARLTERDCFYYIIEQTYDVGLHSRRHPMEFDAGTRPFASFNAPSS